MKPQDLDRAAAALAKRMYHTILPICGATKDGEYDSIGSGTLVKFEERYFLATAKHVLDENKGDIYNPLNNPTTLYIGNPGYPHVILSGKGAEMSDPPDIALVELSDDTLADLWNCYFLDPDTDFSPSDFTTTWGMVMGYQAETVTVNDVTETVRHEPLIYSNTGCDREGIFVRIPIEQDKILDQGKPVKIGALNGVSGGGMFWLRSLTEPEATNQLAGITIEYPGGTKLIATDVNMLRRLFEKFPKPTQP
jgi:hypothetical protein